MARITKQFLTSRLRYRDYEMDDVEVTVTPMSKVAAAKGTSIWLNLHSGRSRRQAIALSREDVRSLSVELLRSLETDRELHAALKEYFALGRHDRPIEG